jgi:hypothetical protein
MLTKIFLLIELVLKLFSVWDLFIVYVDEKYRAKIDENRKARELAVEDSKKAETDAEIWDSQDKIVRSQP